MNKRHQLIFLLTFSIGILNAQITYDNQKAPELTFEKWFNSDKDLDVIDGKPVVLEFWATWCASCIEAIPHINQLSQHFENKITFISVNTETEAKVEQFLIKKEFHSLVAHDKDKRLGKALNIYTLPVSIVIDKNGMLRWKGHAHQLTEELLETFLATDVIEAPDSENDKISIDQHFSFVKNNGTIEVVVPAHLKLERIFDTNFQKRGDGESSIDYNFDKGVYLDFKKMDVESVLIALLNHDKRSNRELIFEGDNPNLFNVNFLLESDRVEHNEFVLNEIVAFLAERFQYSIERTTKQEKVWTIREDGLDLKKFISEHQDQPLRTDKKDNYLMLSNVDLNFLALLLTRGIINEKTVYIDDNLKKYDFQIPMDQDVNSIQKYLKENYDLQMEMETIPIEVITVNFLKR